MAILKCWIPKGIPTMVMQKISPKTTCTSAVSHQLASLKKTKLVRSRKIGKNVFYSMADEHIENIYRMAYEHIKE